MRKNFTRFLFLTIGLFLLLCFSCQVRKSNKIKAEKLIWTPVLIEDIQVHKDSLPKKFKAFQLDIEGLRKRMSLDSSRLSIVEAFPSPDSAFVNYTITEVQVMAPALAAKYPKIKTYEGVEVANIANKARIDFNDKNFHAYFRTLQGEYLISPAGAVEKNYYIVYKKEDAPFPKLPFEGGEH